jgi:hypothetical protein
LASSFAVVQHGFSDEDRFCVGDIGAVSDAEHACRRGDEPPPFRALMFLFLLVATSGLTIAVEVVLWGAAWMIGLV